MQVYVLLERSLKKQHGIYTAFVTYQNSLMISPTGRIEIDDLVYLHEEHPAPNLTSIIDVRCCGNGEWVNTKPLCLKSSCYTYSYVHIRLWNGLGSFTPNSPQIPITKNLWQSTLEEK